MQGTPAQKAGMLKGDVVIRINDKSILNSNHLRNEIANAGAFVEIEMELIRDGKTILIKLKLDERPRKLSQVKVAPQPIPELEQVEMLGMVVEELTEETATQLGIETGTGIVIVAVKPGSPAEKTGLLAGMIVQEVERQAIVNLSIFKEIVSEMDPEKGILLLIKKANGSRYIFLQAD
jgi:serine protease Do